MLTHLSIKHLTLVDRLELEFSPGMSVITGETGAGKSIMLGALGLALGDRADSSLIMGGADKAEISASFDVSGNPDAVAWLDDKSLNDDNQCILRRVVSKDGRSRAFINGSNITLAELRQLSEMLLDIHSQHEHQSLLKKETHRRLLDDFGGLGDVVADLDGRYTTMSELEATLQQTRADAEEQSARVQLLSYQVDELANLSVGEDETEQLEVEQKRLASAEQTMARLNQVRQFCDSESEGASALLGSALTQLDAVGDDALASVREMLGTALIQVDEAMADLESLIEKFDMDPARLHEVEDRLGRIYETARKHKVSPGELAALTARLQAELDSIINADSRIAELEAELTSAEEAYRELAEKLSASRAQTAKLLQTEVTEQLQSLGMDGADFQIALDLLESPSRQGLDDIEFLITTIPGTTPGALSKIASGGELSRISLAIQVVTARTSATPTLVFDEVDVGVGGATAEVIGSLLRKLGGNAQIICVTHLPQVAAQGHQHYRVQKSTTADSASTTVVQLDEEQKVDEIARMLGGIEKTDESLAHAESMLASGNKP